MAVEASEKMAGVATQVGLVCSLLLSLSLVGFHLLLLPPHQFHSNHAITAFYGI